MGKDDAPQGPDFNKLLKAIEPYIQENNDLFKEAMKFGKGQFSKGEEWVKKLEDFGTDSMGRLNKAAGDFKSTVAGRIGELDKAGAEWGKKAGDIYGENKKLATDVTGKLMPGMGQSAELGGELLDSYQTAGIPFQDEYLAKLGGWDTTGRREDRAAQAVNDIAMTSEAAREAELRRLESYGIDPSQTRSAALDSRIQAQNAVAKAVAANQQRQAVEAEGLTLGKTASDIWNERAKMGVGAIESAVGQGRTIAEIARQPGADYLAELAKLGQYGIGVGGLEQSGGTAGFDMQRVAEQMGLAGKTAAAGQQNTANNYGSNVYDQGAKINAGSADMLTGAYGTAGQLHSNDLAAWQANQENSFGGQLGELAGIAAPFVLDWALPGSGTALKTATGGMFGGKKEGGPVRREESPSKGAIPDDVPAMVDAGEFIFDRDTARWFGEKHLRNMQSQAKKGLGIPEAA